jgi:hypothetical protein
MYLYGFVTAIVFPHPNWLQENCREKGSQKTSVSSSFVLVVANQYYNIGYTGLGFRQGR